MRHPYFHKAAISCYNELIPDDSQPNYFLIFDVDPETIDVNIHPTKTEIKFENEMPIWQIISASVKESLGRFSVVPSINFDKDDAPEIPAYMPSHHVTMPSINVDKGYNPFKQQDESDHQSGGGGNTPPHYHSSQVMPNWDELYKNFEKSKKEVFDDLGEKEQGDAALQVPSPMLEVDSEPQTVIQVDARYLITLSQDGVLLLDQHRAHLSVIYERLMRQLDGTNVVSQRVLFPEIVHFTEAQSAVFEEIETELEKAGFSVSRLSGGDWSINSVPPGLDNVDVIELLNEVISQVTTGGNSIKERVFENIAMTIATRAAIPYGRVLNDQEMKTLIADWRSLKSGRYAPNGKIIAVVLTLDQLGKMF